MIDRPTIRQLASEKYPYKPEESPFITRAKRNGFIYGYTKAQKEADDD